MVGGRLGAAGLLVVSGLSLALGGCRTTPSRSTRLTADDLHEVTEAMAASLRASDLIGERGPGSPRWVVSIDRVENLSSDLITVSEQWWLMERVRTSLPIRALSEERAIAFVIPAERAAVLGVEAGEPGFGAARRPTHRMDGTFRSVTRRAGRDRTDLYSVGFRVTEIGEGAVLWSDTFEFKRVAYGRGWD